MTREPCRPLGDAIANWPRPSFMVATSRFGYNPPRRRQPPGIAEMGIVEKTQAAAPSRLADVDRFRLRRFVEGLGDELETVSDADRPRRRRGHPRRQSQGGAVPRGRPRAPGTGRQRHRQPRADRPRLRRQAERAAARDAAAAAQQAGHRRCLARRGAGAGGRAHRRRRRSHHAAGPSRARRRRRAPTSPPRSTSWSIRRPAGPMSACAA